VEGNEIMEIITKSIRIVNYESNNVFSRNTTPSFDEYVVELISHVNSNSSTRNFKTRSPDTEAISCIRQIFQQRTVEEAVTQKTDIIAKRLLDKEIEAQHRVARLDINVQKGSLIQALLFDEENDLFTYLLAKVEHSDFVDDEDFSFKTGFSKDKKTLWKSCLIDLPCADQPIYYARIYSNTVARYWWDDFLEFDEMLSDEVNTSNAFKAIESSLNRRIRNIAPRDHTIIRNSIISYFKNHNHFDYDTMIESTIGQYQPIDLPQENLLALKQTLLQLPEDKHFDHQFNSVPSVINARIKKIYDVNQGIRIQITDEIPDIENTINAYRDSDGTKYIKIKTNNDETYKRFYSAQ
jgi:hypothetical protein